MSTLITSANPHDSSSAHSNVAIKIDDHIWKDAIKSEEPIGRFSSAALPLFENTKNIIDENGNTEVQLLTEGKIGKKLLDIIANTAKGDRIDMVMFNLSDRKTIRAFLQAHKRGVEIRLILDPNKDSFGYKKTGVPNRPVAAELKKHSSCKIKIRWYKTHGEQCHSKFMITKTKDGYSMIIGSANFTKKNIGDYNLETDAFIRSSSKIKAFEDAYGYINRIWNNENGTTYTVDYDAFEKTPLYKYLLYRLMEVTGLSSF